MLDLSLRGRMTRSAFWARHCLALPVGLFLCVSSAQLLGSPWDAFTALALTLWLMSVWGRRLHDRNLSAFWLLLVAIPVIGALILIAQCAFLGAAEGAERFGPNARERADYTRVGGPA